MTTKKHSGEYTKMKMPNVTTPRFVQYTPDGIEQQAGIIIGNQVDPVLSEDGSVISPGSADLVVVADDAWYFKIGVTQDQTGLTKDTWKTF